MTLELEGGFDPLIIEWTKQSGGYREYFMIGTSPGASDVVWWGLTLPLWSDWHFSLGHTIYDTTFYFIMNDANDSQPIGNPHLEFYSDVVAAELSGDMSHGGMVVSKEAKGLKITYNCRIEGISPITLSIPVSGYETIQVKWTKRCGSIRSDFAIGSRPYYDDVVSMGISTWSYSSVLHTAFVFPDREFSSFYLSQQNLIVPPDDDDNQRGNEASDLVSPAAPSADITIHSIRVSTTHNSCTPFLLGNATVPSASITPADSFLELMVWYNCTRPGSTNVTISIVLEGPYAPVSFTWHKRVGEGRNALRIGTHESWDDVVSRGVPTPLYDPSTFSSFYSTSHLYADFYAQMTHEYSTQVVSQIRVTSSSAWCRPSISAHWKKHSFSIVSGSSATNGLNSAENGDEISSSDLDIPPMIPPSYIPAYNETIQRIHNWTGVATVDGGVLTSQPQKIRVYFNCIVGGSTETNVTFDLADWGPLTISMKVYSGGSRPYLDVGTIRGASDVVQGGIPTPLWNSPPLNGAIVSGNVLWTAFWLGMSAPNVTQLMSPPYLTFQTQDPIISPFITGSFSSGGALDNNFNSIVNVTYNCTGLGTVPISIGFILPPYDTITFTWTKVCSAQRIGLMVGSNSGDHSVVQNGLPSMAWNPMTHVAFVLPTITQSTFWVGLEVKKSNFEPNGHAAPPNPAVATEETQTITNVIVNSSLPICSPYIEGSLQPGSVLHAGSFMPILVVYNCTDIGNTDIQVTLMLTGNYMPVSWMWTKRAGGTFSGLSVGTTAPIGAVKESFTTSTNDPLEIASNQLTKSLFSSQVIFSNDVIYYGTATYAYDPISHTHTSTSHPKTFYVGVSSIPVPIKSLRMLPALSMSLSPWLLPSVGGPMSAARTMMNDSSSQFTIDPHCLLGSRALNRKPTVFGFVTAVPFNPAIFAYSITCPPNVPGLSVGFNMSRTDVVTDGVPHAAWSPANVSRIEIEADYNILRFWVSAPAQLDLASILIAEDGIIIAEPIGDGTLQNWKEMNMDEMVNEMDPEYIDSMQRLMNTVEQFKKTAALEVNDEDSSTDDSGNSEDGDVSNLRQILRSTEDTSRHASSSKRSALGYPSIPTPACRAALSGDVWDSMKVSLEPRLLQLELNCSIGGTNNVSVILVPKDPAYSSTVWTFSKTMGGYRHGFDVTVAAAYSTNATFSNATPMDVMINGEATDAWVSHVPDPVPISSPSTQQPSSTIPSPTASNPSIGASPAPGPVVASPVTFVPIARQQTSSPATSFVIELSNVYFGRDPLQEYAAPAINVSSPGCAPVLLGPGASAGYLEKNVPKAIDVISNCYNATDGRLSVFEMSIAIPPFQPAVWAWSRASTGLPTYLNVDAQLDSKVKKWVPILTNGDPVTPPAWLGSSFMLKFYLNTSQFENLGIMQGLGPNSVPKLLLNATTLFLDGTPLVNTTAPNCNWTLSGNATDEDEPRSLSLFGAPLVLRVDASTCNASTADFTISFAALPFTTPMTVKVSRYPPAPQKSKVSSALLGIIIGSTLLIITAISVGLYLCLRRPAVAPSTGAYHLRRRKQERQGLLEDDMDAIN